MLWFHRLFPLLLIFLAPLITLCVKRRPGPAASQCAPTMTRLVIASLVFAALHVAVQAWLEATQPMPSVMRMAWPILIGTLGCTTLCIIFAGPALAARNPGFGPVPDFKQPTTDEPGSPEAATRTASLTPRNTALPIPQRAWSMGWATFCTCFVITLWTIAEGAHPIMILGLGWWLGMSLFGSRAAHLSAEPLDPGGSAKLLAAYAGERHFRAWGFFNLGLAGTIGYTVITATMFLWPEAASHGGALIGSGLGVAGACFGVISSMRQATSRALLHDLHQQHESGNSAI